MRVIRGPVMRAYLLVYHWEGMHSRSLFISFPPPRSPAPPSPPFVFSSSFAESFTTLSSKIGLTLSSKIGLGFRV